MTTGGKKTSQRNENKQIKFCKEYIKDFNGEKAAIRAGYAEKSARSMASQLLTKINIKNKINDLLKNEDLTDTVQIKQIIAEMCKIAFSDIKDFEKFFDTGNLEDVEGYTEVIQEITKTYTAKGKPVYKLKLCSKEKALEMLGRYKALFTDNVNHSGTIAAMDKAEIQAAIIAGGKYEKKKK